MIERSAMSVEEEEKAAQVVLSPELSKHLELANRTYNLIWRVAASFDGCDLSETPLPVKVRLVLLVRLADDLRASAHLCLIGYSVQACTIAASVFENAHTIAYIGQNQRRAEEWDSHNEPLRPFKPVREMVKGNYQAYGSPSPEATFRNEYDVYTQLCWMKHTNPLLQDFRDPRFWTLHGTLAYAPDTTEDGIRRSWLALQHASRLAMLAISVFDVGDLDEPHHSEVAKELLVCTELERTLNSQAIARWGTERPLDGKW